MWRGGERVVVSGSAITLAPGELLVAHAAAAPKATARGGLDASAAQAFADGPRVVIEAAAPVVDDGSLPVKRLVGEVVTVEADVICDGHDKLGVVLQWRSPGDAAPQEVRMRPVGNDRYRAELPLERIGAYEYTIEAWRDAFATYKDEVAKKSAAGIDVSLELREGLLLLERAAPRAPAALQGKVQAVLAPLQAADDAARLQAVLSPELSELMAQADDRPRAATLPRRVRIDAERSGGGIRGMV